MLNEFIVIISSLNNGTVISGLNNNDTEILLAEPSLKLYYSNHKHYFLSEYQDDYDIIEKNIQNNQFVKAIKDIRPNNSYLILFYKINSFDEDVSKKIIRLEENEFFYKKYVFYYTAEEYESFREWFNKRPEKSLSNILRTEECSPESAYLYMQFLLRLIIKVPFLNIEFKKMELENFEELLNLQLEGIRNNKEEVRKTFNRLTNELETRSVDEIAEMLFSEVVGGVDDENQIG
jgi:hypothetical protein